MCGIFGFTSWNSQTDRLFSTLANDMESRGSSSWGGTCGTSLIKRLGGITSTIDNVFRTWDTRYGLIFHTRAPSAGTGRTVEDAHPFLFSRELALNNTKSDEFILTKKIIGIHNGYVSTHNNLKTKYPDRKDFSVDSMHLFKHILDDLPLTEISGSGAIAWFETICKEYTDPTKPGEYLSSRLFLARFDSDALHIGKLDTGEMVFASTKTTIERAARLTDVNIVEYLTIKPRKRYELTKDVNGAGVLTELEDMNFGTSTNCYQGGVINGTYQAPGLSSSSFQRGTANSRGAFPEKSGVSFALYESQEFSSCPGCNTFINPTTHALCDECLEWWITQNKNVLAN